MRNDEPQIEVKKDDELVGQFVVSPLMNTFGYTIGNALRRVLLSNIEGAAVTSIRIDGVKHEFQTIDGVREDVTEFMLNMRGLYVKMNVAPDDRMPREIFISRKGSGKITGADIQCPNGDVVVVNPDVYLCEITDDNAEFNVVMTVEKGYGYVLPEKQQLIKKDIGIIPMASVFTPVVKVSYTVESTRVGHNTNYDRLTLNIETNGTIRPGEVLVEAAGILIRQFNMIRSFAGDIPELSQVSDDGASDKNPKLKMKVDELEFSHRTANCLRKENIQFVHELVSRSESELLHVRSFGRKSLDEVKAKLKELGLHLKLDDSKWVSYDSQGDASDEAE